jgi:hypothetical protein
MALRYWVGGTGSWNGTAGTKWATTSGGAGGAAEPTTADDVFFDANSGTGTVTVATTPGSARSVDFTGFAGTFAGAVALTVAGSWTYSTTMTRTYTGTVTFTSTVAGNTVTSNGKNFGGSLVFSGAGGAWALRDGWTQPAANFVQVTAGALTTGAFTFSWGAFTSNNANVRTVDITGATINLIGAIASSWNFSNSSNLTFVSTGSYIKCTNGNAVTASQFNVGTKPFASIEFGGAGSGTYSFNGTSPAVVDNIYVSNTGGAIFDAVLAVQCKNLDMTGFNGTFQGSNTWTFNGGTTCKRSSTMTDTYTGAMTFVNTSGTYAFTCGVAMKGELWCNAAGGTVQFADTFIMNGAEKQLKLTAGTIDCNSQTVSVPTVNLSFSGTGGVRAFIAGNGNTITVTDPFTSWTTGLGPLNLTVDMGTSNLIFTDVSANDKTLDASGCTFYQVTFTSGGTGINYVHGLPATFPGGGPTTIRELITTPGTAIIVTFRSFFITPGDTFYNIGKFTLQGSTSARVTLNCQTPGARVDISKTSGDVYGSDYVDIQDMLLHGGARWWMGAHSTDLGNNSGVRYAGLNRTPIAT